MLRALCFSVALLVCLGFATVAGAQDSLRIATANPARIFNEMQETKDLKEKLEAEGKDLAAQDKAKQEEVQEIQKALNQLKEGSSQFGDKQKQLIEKAIQYDTWKKINQAQVLQTQKLTMKLLFDKITEATKIVAADEKIDLVIAEIEVNFDMNQISNIDQLRQLINQRNVLFNSGKLDISAKITAKLDAEYKTGGAKK